MPVRSNAGPLRAFGFRSVGGGIRCDGGGGGALCPADGAYSSGGGTSHWKSGAHAAPTLQLRHFRSGDAWLPDVAVVSAAGGDPGPLAVLVPSGSRSQDTEARRAAAAYREEGDGCIGGDVGGEGPSSPQRDGDDAAAASRPRSNASAARRSFSASSGSSSPTTANVFANDTVDFARLRPGLPAGSTQSDRRRDDAPNKLTSL
mmetsp:Transcript_14367/g.44625  ORF Transcript_14367/g.44625 Transcript_14367/m.44625 type:complete len:203 (+) Transcript_14367:484-1092(+)